MGTEFIAVRHCSALRIEKSRAKLRTDASASSWPGSPPGAEKRPITGVRPRSNTLARESAAPLPLLSK